jgi:hypothetical protein
VTPLPLAPLSPHWAFVVQLREGTPLTPAHLTGRVEHLVSGQATPFASLAELLAFMAHVLNTLRPEPPATAPPPTAAASSPESPSAPRSPRRPSARGAKRQS